MVLSALDVDHPVLRGVVNVVSLDACVPREVEDFLSGDHHGVRVVEACQVNVLVGVVVVVHLLKDLPGDIDFDPLPHGLEQIPVLAAGVLCATRHAMLSVQLGPCRFHHGVEDGVILLTNTLLHNKVLPYPHGMQPIMIPHIDTSGGTECADGNQRPGGSNTHRSRGFRTACTDHVV